MIFVTVGTHEQQFDRLIKKVDELKLAKKIVDNVFIQKGYSNYTILACENSKLIGSTEMESHLKEAQIVITHGGPGSIFSVIKNGKVPIVVPRLAEFKEHVDNHQLEFSKFLEQKNYIIAVKDINDLEDKIINYDKIVNNMPRVSTDTNVKKFTSEFEKIVNGLLKKNI